MADIKKNKILFPVEHVTYCIRCDVIRTSYSDKRIRVKYHLPLCSASRQSSQVLNITFKPNRQNPSLCCGIH